MYIYVCKYIYIYIFIYYPFLPLVHEWLLLECVQHHQSIQKEIPQ